MTIWDFADRHTTAFVLCVWLSSWGFAWGVGGWRLFNFKVSNSKTKEHTP